MGIFAKPVIGEEKHERSTRRLFELGNADAGGLELDLRRRGMDGPERNFVDDAVHGPQSRQERRS